MSYEVRRTLLLSCSKSIVIAFGSQRFGLTISVPNGHQVWSLESRESRKSEERNLSLVGALRRYHLLPDTILNRAG